MLGSAPFGTSSSSCLYGCSLFQESYGETLVIGFICVCISPVRLRKPGAGAGLSDICFEITGIAHPTNDLRPQNLELVSKCCGSKIAPR